MQVYSVWCATDFQACPLAIGDISMHRCSRCCSAAISVQAAMTKHAADVTLIPQFSDSSYAFKLGCCGSSCSCCCCSIPLDPLALPCAATSVLSDSPCHRTLPPDTRHKHTSCHSPTAAHPRPERSSSQGCCSSRAQAAHHI